MRAIKEVKLGVCMLSILVSMGMLLFARGVSEEENVATEIHQAYDAKKLPHVLVIDDSADLSQAAKKGINLDKLLEKVLLEVEPILPLDVVGFLFPVVESRCSKCQRTGIAKVACSTNSAEERLELVFLLAVEVHLETLYILQCAELRLAVCRLKVVVVAVDIGNGIE